MTSENDKNDLNRSEFAKEVLQHLKNLETLVRTADDLHRQIEYESQLLKNWFKKLKPEDPKNAGG